MFQPVVDNEQCIQCGICAKVCPGLGAEYPDGITPIEAVYGPSLITLNAWSKNAGLRHVAASGGVVSTLIEALLRQGEYDLAFSVNSCSCGEQLKTVPITADDLPEDWKDADTPKSRYLPVSHENAVAYLKTHQDKRIIFTGTSCAIRGLRNVIDQLHRRRDQYLLIGLFCDKIFHYNVYDYFSHSFAKGKHLHALHFKNKESGGWPGNMKFMFDDGSSCYQDKAEREKVKEYFMPERCLYCADKLNVTADISLGDNYTEQNSSPLGSNSVMIRTQQGQKAWNIAAHLLAFEPVECEKLYQAQYLEGRLNNLYFAALKEQQIKKKTGMERKLNSGIVLIEKPSEYEQAWKHRLAMIRAGEQYQEKPKELDRQFRKAERRKKSADPVVLAERFYYALKRRMMK